MALISCPECGREVSDQAEACPRCAYPVAKKMTAVSREGPEVAPEGLVPSSEGEAGPGDGEEQLLWSGSPSQLVNLKAFAGAGLAALLLIGLTFWFNYWAKGESPAVFWTLSLLLGPIGVVLWKWLRVSCHRYELTSERIKVRTGVFSRDHEVVELYRVKDVSLERPFLMRLCGLGNVQAFTSDKTLPLVAFYAVRGPVDLAEKLRKHVERRRVHRRVREVDIE